MSETLFALTGPASWPPEERPQPARVVYLHGFRSSPQSMKAQKTQAAFARLGWSDRLWTPMLPASPASALTRVEDKLAEWISESSCLALGDNVVFVGSSLGGYYATVLGERYPKARVVLLNPAVVPYRDLENQLGRRQIYFSEDEIDFVPAYLDELRQMEVHSLHNPGRYLLFAASGDEVLSFEAMVSRYAGAYQCQINGSDHALSDYDQWLPMIMTFLGAL